MSRHDDLETPRSALRRGLLKSSSALALCAAAGLRPTHAAEALLLRTIPSTGERIPAIGLGSWITFNVGRDPLALERSAEIVRAFLAAGGSLIDSSPMYGSAQETIGYALSRLGPAPKVFAADKVWIGSGDRGPAQIAESRKRWQLERFDLLQVHNLLAWEAHLATLFAMKAEGSLRYVGISTSEGRRHAELERIMREQPIDFVQLSYNAADRAAEQRLLPLARERGIAVIANRPFRQGDLIRVAARRPLPAWAAEIGCANWAQLLLKFIVSHPAVHCAIPATSRLAHLKENMGAGVGPMPDGAMRQRIADEVAQF